MNYTPIFVLCELTLDCNANCIHCASKAGSKRDNELTTKEWINLFSELKDLGTTEVFFSGGEPTLRNDFYELISGAVSEGLNYGFITNGLIGLDYYYLNKIKPRTIGVSIDGLEETHNKVRGVPNAYKRTWATINDCVKYELPVSVVTAVGSYNFNDLRKLETEILFNKVRIWQLQAVVPEGRANKDLILSEDQFYELCTFIADERDRVPSSILDFYAGDNLGYYGTLDSRIRVNPWTGCFAGRQTAAIMADGGIKPCLSIMHPSAILGNIRVEGFTDVWNNDELFKFYREDKGAEGECANCGKAQTCRGGCSATMIGFNGEYRREHPYCILRYENKFKQKLIK